ELDQQQAEKAYQDAEPQFKKLSDNLPAENLRPLWQDVERQQQLTARLHQLELDQQQAEKAYQDAEPQFKKLSDNLPAEN
ncbi:hypothetical protein KDV41_21565, partial [Providencia stuartii]|uniref:hypothetical protein n=1 Tax=Providencia stuartii TaxID=588 RepID=UPI003329FCAD